MESSIRYYARRAEQEHRAARTAVTEAARLRRLALAQQFEARVSALAL